jgi:uncharacterized protein (TIGR02246 family)
VITQSHRSRTLLLVTIMQLAIIISTSRSALAQTVSSEPVDGTAIRAVWSTLDAAWNQRDVEQFSSLFTDDVSFVFVDRGQWLAGRAAVHERFAAQFPTMASDLRHRTHVQKYRMIAPDVAGVDGKVEILGPDANAGSVILRTFAIFAVMVREQQGWRIEDLRVYQLSAEI